jgi:hypothetical protein
MDDQAPGYRALHSVRRLLGYVVVITLVVIDPASWPYLVAPFGVSVLFGQLQSMLALLIEETGFRRYGRAGMTRLLGWALLEIAWYRPLLALWRTWAMVALLFGRLPGDESRAGPLTRLPPSPSFCSPAEPRQAPDRSISSTPDRSRRRNTRSWRSAASPRRG